jgi:hypothetical protein
MMSDPGVSARVQVGIPAISPGAFGIWPTLLSAGQQASENGGNNLYYLIKHLIPEI